MDLNFFNYDALCENPEHALMGNHKNVTLWRATAIDYSSFSLQSSTSYFI